MKFAIDQIIDLRCTEETMETQLDYAKHQIFHKIADEIPDTVMNGTHTFKLTLKGVVAGFDMGRQKITITADLERMEYAATNPFQPVPLLRDEFDALRYRCKYYKPALDEDHNLIDTCRCHNSPGISWTDCSYASCPLIKTEN